MSGVVRNSMDNGEKGDDGYDRPLGKVWLEAGSRGEKVFVARLRGGNLVGIGLTVGAAELGQRMAGDGKVKKDEENGDSQMRGLVVAVAEKESWRRNWEALRFYYSQLNTIFAGTRPVNAPMPRCLPFFCFWPFCRGPVYTWTNHRATLQDFFRPFKISPVTIFHPFRHFGSFHFTSNYFNLDRKRDFFLAPSYSCASVTCCTCSTCCTCTLHTRPAICNCCTCCTSNVHVYRQHH